MNDDLPYHLGFSHFLGIGPMRFSALIGSFGNVRKAYLADGKDLAAVIGNRQAEKFVKFRNLFDPVKKLEEFKRKGIKTIAIYSQEYPRAIRNISDPPICLYVRGDLNNFDFDKDLFFGIVGTRTPTSYGQQIAAKFSAELVRAGFSIVSGMAIGIDAVAHQTALNNEGRTIAFLGCGVDIIYPAVNASLYHKIIHKGGLVMSEFPPGEIVVKGLFIARNRLISGLAKGVLIAEGAKDSGAMITARYAAEQGKEVFAPPGPLNSAMSAAPNLLLREGARLVTSVQDILTEFNIMITTPKKEALQQGLNEEELTIFTALQKGNLSADEIVVQTSLNLGNILNSLSMLEIKSIIEKNSEGKFQIKL